MMYCRECRADNPNSATHCGNCGADLQAIRVVFCNECLAENRRSATHCVDCGADLQVVRKTFSEEMRQRAPVARRGTYGLVGGTITSAFFGFACAVLFPDIFLHKLVFYAGLLIVFVTARYCGLRLADFVNDTSLS